MKFLVFLVGCREIVQRGVYMKPIFSGTTYNETVETKKRFFRKFGLFGAQGAIVSLLLFVIWTHVLHVDPLYGTLALLFFLLACVIVVISAGCYAAILFEEWSMPKIEKYVRRKLGNKDNPDRTE